MDLKLVKIKKPDEINLILGVVDGLKPKGIESNDDIKKRKDFLRKIGYKF